MSIRDRQVSDAEQQVLLSELQAGRYPELSSVQRLISEAFKSKAAGLPRFDLYKMENGQVSDPEKFNYMVTTMKEDVTTGYGEVTNQQNQMMGMAEYYETEKNKVNREITKLSRKIEAVLAKASLTGKTNVFTQHFHDFLQVDFDGDKNRNIPASDVLVDLTKAHVTLDKITHGAARHDISNADIHVSMKEKPVSTETLSDLNNIINDKVNSAWRYVITLAEVKPFSIVMDLKLEKPVTATTISFISESPAATTIELQVSADGQTYSPQGEKVAKGLVSWSIPSKDIAFIRFVLTKAEPDATVGTESKFFFGGSRIIVQQDLFQSEGKLVSKPFPVQDAVIDKVQIDTTSTKLPNTNIRYYVGIDDNVNSVDWVESDATGLVDFRAYQAYSGTLDQTIPGYGSPVDAPQFGNQNYKLADMTFTPKTGSTKLFMGDRMYQIDTMNRPVPAVDPVSTGPEEWANALAGAYETKYIGLEETVSSKTIPLTKGTWNRLSMSFLVTGDMMPFREQLTIDNGTVVAVYLNNTLLKGIQGVGQITYTYKFQKGQNTLQIYTYTSRAANGYIAPNLNLPMMYQIGWVYANPVPLTEVSLDYLYNNTSVRDYGKFAWKGNQIVVNYNPVSKDAKNLGVRYALGCSLTDQIAKDTNIRFMAIFTRLPEAADSAAQLHDYKLVVK